MHLLSYIKARFEERSTWAAIGVGITGAAALSMPWSAALVIVGIIGALVPTGGGTNGG